MEITEYNPSHFDLIVKLMNEFSKYLEASDKTKITTFQDGGAFHFTNKMVTFANEKNGKVFVAIEGGKVVGFVGGHIANLSEDEKFEVSYKKPGEIRELFVTSKYRKKGIGKLLLNELEKHFKNIGCDVIKLSVLSVNIKARTFYESSGFKDTNVIMAKLLP